jgi:hypothetical protein
LKADLAFAALQVKFGSTAPAARQVSSGSLVGASQASSGADDMEQVSPIQKQQ